MEHKPTSQVLHEAADWIQRQGWVQGDGWPMHSPPKQTERLCLEGGIAAALGLVFSDIRDDYTTLTSSPAYRAVGHFLGEGYGNGRLPLYAWNDRASRSKEDVIVLLRSVAEVEELREESAARPLTITL